MDDNVWNENDELTMTNALATYPIETNNRVQHILNSFPVNKRALAENRYFEIMGLDALDQDEAFHEFALQELNFEELPQLLQEVDQEPLIQIQDVDPPNQNQEIQMRDGPWTQIEKEDGLIDLGPGNWALIAEHYVRSRTADQVKGHSRNVEYAQLIAQLGNQADAEIPQIGGGPWTPEEDDALQLGLEQVGAGNWTIIAQNYVRTRNAGQVRSRSRTAAFAAFINN